MIRAVIFDLGGVLVRTEDLAPRTNYAQRLGLTRVELENMVFNNESGRRATVGAIPVTEHWENVRRELKLAREEMDALQASFWGGDKLDSALVDFLRSLRAHYRTALLSNAWSDLRLVLVERLNIADAFDELFISAELGLAKPDARIFQFVLNALNVAPDEAIFVDDFAENVESARRIGIHVIQFQSAEQTRAEVEQMLARNER